MLNDDGADADNRLTGVLTRRPCSVYRYDVFFGLEAQRMQHAALASDEPVLNPEFVITGAGRDLAVIWILLAAAPLGVHRASLDARDHAHVTLRRSGQD